MMFSITIETCTVGSDNCQSCDAGTSLCTKCDINYGLDATAGTCTQCNGLYSHGSDICCQK